MGDNVVMWEEDSDNTLSVKELDAFLPPLTSPQGHVYPPPYQHPDGYLCHWRPVMIADLPPQEELERNVEKLIDEMDAYVPPPDEPVPVNGFKSPDFFDYLPPSHFEYRMFVAPAYTPCPVYSPPAPGGHWYMDHSQAAQDAMHAQSLLFAKIGLHCYNLENGTNFERLGLPQVANTDVFTLEAIDPIRNYTCKFETITRHAIENKDCFHVITTRCRTLSPTTEEEEEKSGFDTFSVDEVFKGNMPDWLPDDHATSKLQYYEMKESEVEQDKEWLHLYAELAWYTRKQLDPYMFEYSNPFELEKVIVQTREVVDSMKKIKVEDNAVFYISFKTRCGDVCKGIIRRTRDGRPEHLSLEAKCL